MHISHGRSRRRLVSNIAGAGDDRPAARRGVRAQVALKIVSERLGHTTVTITLDLYSHARESMLMEAARMAADIVCGEIGRRS
jgi:integrase